jgi:hypothetical protein
MDVGDIHRLVEKAFNAGDTDALVALYEEDAAMATPDGTFVSGRDAIREQWSGFVALGGNIQMTPAMPSSWVIRLYSATTGTLLALVWSCRPEPRRWHVVSPMGLGSM